MFKCATGTKCVPMDDRCDTVGGFDCDDGSDEANCTDWCRTNAAQEKRLICDNGAKCPPKGNRCDADLDCKDGIDEANCTGWCRVNSVQEKRFMCPTRDMCPLKSVDYRCDKDWCHKDYEDRFTRASGDQCIETY